MDNQRKVIEQIEEILKKKGVRPSLLSDEQIMARLVERLQKLLPLFADRVMDGIIHEELAKVGRTKKCRSTDLEVAYTPCPMLSSGVPA